MANKGSPSPKFDSLEVSYKRVRATDIPVSIWIPKSLGKGEKCAVAVRWHGGGLVTGSRLTDEYLADWIPQLMDREKAILITPDYRLLPEANGFEILKDVRDFWSWLLTPGQLKEHLPSGLIPELDHVLVLGESAGGFLALHSALSTAVDHISALVLQYPIIDARAPHYSKAYEKRMFDPPFPQLDPGIFRDHMSLIRPDQPPVYAGAGPDRLNLTVVVTQQGLYEQLLGQDSSIYPLEILPRSSSLPPTWIIHGTGDTIVPIEGTHKFVEMAKHQFADWKLHTSFVPGEHMLDKTYVISPPETPWLAEGLDFIRAHWI